MTIHLDAPQDSSEQAVAHMINIDPLADDLGRVFEQAGLTLHLVGGSVRDAFLGRSGGDLDFTTEARPEQVRKITRGWADGVWDLGIAFGTLGLIKNERRLEITTYRSEQYDRSSRNPQVQYGDSLEQDLVRRDFTVNAMAVSVPGHVFVDPHGGLGDLARQVLRTPGRATDSFDDDPLRILRAARFVAQLGLTPDPEVVAAMSSRAERLSIVAVERIRDELVKLLLGADPVAGLELLVRTGVAAQPKVIPELPALQLEIDEHHQHKDVYQHTLTVLRQAIALEPDGPDLELRLAALLHDIGKPRTRRKQPGGRVSFHHHEVVGRKMSEARMNALRFPAETVATVSRLIELHLRFHGYSPLGGRAAAEQQAASKWTDSAVRRYVYDAGPVLDRLHLLVRSDCTTRNKRKAAALARSYDDLEARIARLRAQEEMEAIRPDLNGHQVMEILGVPPGRIIGAAMAHLLELRLEHGPLGEQRATEELLRWAHDQQPADGRSATG